MKSDSFWPFIDLPAESDATFELAIGSASAPRALLARKGGLGPMNRALRRA